jgi:translation initiation factor 3 subunit A
MLRNQLTSLQKAPIHNPNRVSRPAWEWTPEAVEYHLNTRFAQLEVATSLELWNEGYRTVEDIYAIIVASNKTPKPKLMTTYYEKLTRIFWVSDNKLFHAYAWYRYYCLSCETRKDLKQEEKSVLASCVLLSALTVPHFKDIYSSIALDDQAEVVVDKNSQMALLLNFQDNPSRQTLLEDIVSKGILAEVVPELSTLYACLEGKFQPLQLIKNVIGAVAAVKAHPQMAQYAAPLQKIVVLKAMQQLSKVYSSVRLAFVYKLVSGLEGITANQVERILIEGVAAKHLQLRVNHSAGTIQFLSTQETNAQIEVQVSQFGAIMNKVSSTIAALSATKESKEEKINARRAFLTKVLYSTDDEYSTCVDRKAQIERRKEDLEKLQVDRLNKEREIKELEEDRRITSWELG